jgi:hypothetical protein
MSEQDDTNGSTIVDSMQAQRQRLLDEGGPDLIDNIEMIYHIWWRWADFHLYVTTPILKPFNKRQVLQPELIEGTDQYEFVYPIADYGDRFSTSKGLELFSAGLSMWKLYCTIEKIIFVLIERVKATGTTTETEIQIAFAGHELAQRKAFESIINLNYNIVISNFDPGRWGERYLQVVKHLADKGYGYPSSAPRQDVYRRKNIKPKAKNMR